jgi:hypothetical protein
MNVVACVYWKGVFKNREKVYSPEWVYILRNMVKRHMPTDEDYRFVCLTNVPNEFDGSVETITLKHNWPGWWSKLELFRPGVFEEGDRVFYLDLDSVIVRDLMPFFDFKADIAIMRSLDAKRYGTQWWFRGEQTIVRYGSTAIVWTVPFGREFYEKFNYTQFVERKKLRGDQDWMALCNPNLEMFDTRWIMKLRNLKNRHTLLEEDVKIVLPMAPGMRLKNITAAETYSWIAEAWK